MTHQSNLSPELSRGVSNDVLLNTPMSIAKTKHFDDGACYDTDTASTNGYSASLSTPNVTSAPTSVISRRQSTVFGELEQQLTDTLSHDGVATVSPQGATPSNSMTPIPTTPPPTFCHESPSVKSSPTRWLARYLSKHHSAFQVVLNALLKQKQIDGSVTVVHNSTPVIEEEDQPMPHNPLMVLLYKCILNNIHTTIVADLSKVEEDRHVEVTGWIGALKSNVTSVYISNERRKQFDQFVTNQRLVILSSCQRSESDEDEVQQIMVTGIDELIVAAVRNQFCVMIHV